MVQISLLCLTFMLSWITLSRGQSDPPALFPEDCCTKKTVGGVEYTQVPGNTEGFDCTGQCVYEEDGKPGSRTCFKSGGSAPLPKKCTESSIDSAYVSFARNSENFIFNTPIGTYSCTVGSVIEGGTIECSKLAEEEAETLENEMAAFFSSTSFDGKLEWMCFHTTDVGIHCDLDETLTCRSLPSFQSQPDTLYVECGIKIQGSSVKEEIKTCQGMCNDRTAHPDCLFWTLSSNQTDLSEDTHGHRVHDAGNSECGIRNYDPAVLLMKINNTQYTGKRDQSNYSQGSVYVFDQVQKDNPDDCYNHCKKNPFCSVWTWQPKPSGTGSICAINTYTPKRKVIIPNAKISGKPQLTSGCIPSDLCTNLPINCK